MVKKYECERCGELFNNYSHYSSHLMRREPCLMVIKSIKNEYTNTITKKVCMGENRGTVRGDGTKKVGEKKSGTRNRESEKITIKDLSYDDFIKTVLVDGKEYRKCTLCGKQFYYNASINKHYSDRKCAFLGDEMNVNLMHQNFNDFALEYIKKNGMIKQVINNINYVTINNVNQINQINNVNIYPFGQERVDRLVEGVIDNAVKNPETGIIDLIKQIHFNPEIPENSNLRLKKKKTQIMEIFDGNGWMVKDRDTIIHNLLTDKKDIMDQRCELLLDENRINRFVSSNYKDFSEKLDGYLRHSLGGDIPKAEKEQQYKIFYKKLARKVMDVFIVDYEKRKK